MYGWMDGWMGLISLCIFCGAVFCNLFGAESDEQAAPLRPAHFCFPGHSRRCPWAFFLGFLGLRVWVFRKLGPFAWVFWVEGLRVWALTLGSETIPF